jgi:hypothetical protein
MRTLLLRLILITGGNVYAREDYIFCKAIFTVEWIAGL